MMMAVLFVALGSTAFAQGSTNVNANVTASTTIMAALTLSKITDVSFGAISATTPGAVYLSPTGADNTNTGTTTTVGKFTLVGATSSEVKVSWPATITLSTSGAEPNEILYSLLVHGKNTDTPLISTSLGTMGEATSASATLSSDGNYFLFFGGSLGTFSTAKAVGTYPKLIKN